MNNAVHSTRWAQASALLLAFPILTCLALWLLGELLPDFGGTRIGVDLGLTLVVIGCGLSSAVGAACGIRGWTCAVTRYAILARICAIVQLLILLGTFLFFVALHMLNLKLS
jgi:hypothetical protein